LQYSWAVVGKMRSGVVVGKTALAPPVSLPLPLPIAFGSHRIVLAQLLPVVRMLGAPLPHAVLANLPIDRIGGNLSPMVIAAAPPLAIRITTSSLSRLELGWLKCLLAIAANPVSHEPVLAWHRLPMAASGRIFRN
jgi:hypothetical protein